MSALKLETVQWASLNDIDDVEPINDRDHAVLIELKEVLLRHGYTNCFGVCLLHRHFDLEQDEIIITIGVYRVLFDILRPALSLVYIQTFILYETKTFAFMAKESITCKHSELGRTSFESISWAKQALDEIEARFPDGKHATDDAKRAVEATDGAVGLSQSTNWFTCAREQSR